MNSAKPILFFPSEVVNQMLDRQKKLGLQQFARPKSSLATKLSIRFNSLDAARHPVDAVEV
jgi:hypothetical protein